MKAGACCSLLLLFSCAIGAWAADPNKMVVVVVNAHYDPTRPIQGVRVSLSFLDGATRITDAREVTNRDGEALLNISQDAQQREVRLDVTGAPEMAVYQPPDGSLSGSPKHVTIQLLPKGSLALKEPAQIEAWLARAARMNQELVRQNRELNASLLEAQARKPSFDEAVLDWANANGFSYGEANLALQQWADNVQKHKEQSTLRQVVLAELAQRNFKKVVELSGMAMDLRSRELDEDEAAYLEERRKKLQDLVGWAETKANAYQAQLQYHQATDVLDAASVKAAIEHRRFPEDSALRQIWLDALERAANARRDEGETATAAESAKLLSKAVEEYQALLDERSNSEERAMWAEVQNDLGTALKDEASRGAGEKPIALFEAARLAYQKALEVRTRASSPRDWAAIEDNLSGAQDEEARIVGGDQAAALLGEAAQALRQAADVYETAGLSKEWAKTKNDLGIVLFDGAERSSGEKASELLKQACQAYNDALKVRTKEAFPEAWAKTENNLASALWNQANRTSGAESTTLFGQALEAYRNSLQVRTKDALPQDWAKTQNNIGNLLGDEADRVTGAGALALNEESVRAYRSALEVYTKEALPQYWAGTEDNLGITLRSEAERVKGEKAIPLLEEAVEAQRKALEVFTKADSPQIWARAQNDLGTTLAERAVEAKDDKSLALFEQAITAYQSALEVFTKGSLPQFWAGTQDNLGDALRGEAERSSGDRAVALLNQAEEAYKKALEVYTRADLPQDWALIQTALGEVFRDKAQRAGTEASGALLARAVEADRGALEVYTREDSPQEWATAQKGLGMALLLRGDFPAAAHAFESALEALPADDELLQRAEFLYANKLYGYAKAFDLSQRRFAADPSSLNRLDLVEKSLMAGRFENCVEQAAKIGDADIAPALAVVRDVEKLACQWSAGQKQEARQTATGLQPRAAALQPGSLSFEGAKHFLGVQPAFESGRACWVELFASLEKGDGAALERCLRELDGVLRN